MRQPQEAATLNGGMFIRIVTVPWVLDESLTITFAFGFCAVRDDDRRDDAELSAGTGLAGIPG